MPDAHTAFVAADGGSSSIDVVTAVHLPLLTAVALAGAARKADITLPGAVVLPCVAVVTFGPGAPVALLAACLVRVVTPP